MLSVFVVGRVCVSDSDWTGLTEVVSGCAPSDALLGVLMLSVLTDGTVVLRVISPKMLDLAAPATIMQNTKAKCYVNASALRRMSHHKDML
jgi:hypothetical protein